MSSHRILCCLVILICTGLCIFLTTFLLRWTCCIHHRWCVSVWWWHTSVIHKVYIGAPHRLYVWMTAYWNIKKKSRSLVDAGLYFRAMNRLHFVHMWWVNNDVTRSGKHIRFILLLLECNFVTVTEVILWIDEIISSCANGFLWTNTEPSQPEPVGGYVSFWSLIGRDCPPRNKALACSHTKHQSCTNVSWSTSGYTAIQGIPYYWSRKFSIISTNNK